jgi:hypothetical protein
MKLKPLMDSDLTILAEHLHQSGTHPQGLKKFVKAVLAKRKIKEKK